MADRIRVGIVGANLHYGWGSRAHLPALARLPEFDVRAVCTTRMETAQETASQFGIPKAYDDYGAMLADPEIDLVAVAVRVPLHHELVLPAIEAGKHVFCEWPLGANLAEAVEMRDRAQAAGVQHFVDLQARGGPMLNQVRDMIADGYVGDVISAKLLASGSGAGARTAQNAWQADITKGANTLTITAGHNLDALRYLLGDFAEVSAILSTQVTEATVEETGEQVAVTSPDHVLVDGVLRSGAVASVHVQSVPMHGTGLLMEIHGSEGALVIRAEGGANTSELQVRAARRGGSLEPIALAEPYLLPPDTPAGPSVNVGQIYQRIASSIQGGEPADPDFDTAVELHELLDAIERASATGTRQRVGQ